MYGNEIKINRNNGNNLRQTIIDYWQTGEYIPLFVSEGTSQKKKVAIQRSNYLKTVYEEVLTTLEKNMVIFGWSMSEQDNHILEAINKAKPTKLAISIYVRDDDNEETINARCQDYQNKLNQYDNLRTISNNNLHFFDSASPKCWINDNEDDE